MKKADLAALYGDMAGEGVNGHYSPSEFDYDYEEENCFASNRGLARAEWVRKKTMALECYMVGSECPLCGGTIVMRVNRKEGSILNGTRFTGCSNFPRCRLSGRYDHRSQMEYDDGGSDGEG